MHWRARQRQEPRRMRQPIADFAEAVILLDDRRRYALAFGCGLVAALALAPLDLLPALLFAFAPMVWLMDGACLGRGRRRAGNFRSAALLGWCFGFGYFLAGLWWLGVAFVTGGEEFIWLMPLGVIGLPMALALFMAFGFGVSGLLWSGNATRIIALAFGLGLSEWLRGWLFTGFPWNAFGQVFANHAVFAQGAALVGAEGLGLIAVLCASAFATIGTGHRFSARYIAPMLAASLLAALAAFGAARLTISGGFAFDAATMPVVQDVRLRLMQPNVSEAERRVPNAGNLLLRRYLELSDRTRGPQGNGLADVTHLIWPEAPFPFILDREPRALDAITKTLGERTVLITGAVRAEDIEAPEPGGKRPRYFNAMQIYDQNGLQSGYDKVHLVPFGEYLPFEAVLRSMGLRQFVDVIGGFSAGNRRETLIAKGLPPIIPLICYEAIFPTELPILANGSAVIVNITNDAWFGRTPGPYQHLAQIRLRAVEQGYSVIRNANSGISVIFDPYGRIVGLIPLGVADILDSVLPAGLETTLYRQTIRYSYGSVMILLLGLVLLGGSLWRSRSV
jgi:apolipoprotein N-acyltransferase